MRALAAALSITVVACNPFAIWGDATTKRDVADKATARFHSLLDSAQYDAIWTEADSAFRAAGPQKDALSLFRMVNHRFGHMEGTKLVTWNVSISTSYGTLVQLVYRTAYTADSATERFTWRMRDGKPQLLAYNINSPLLMRAMLNEKN